MRILPRSLITSGLALRVFVWTETPASACMNEMVATRPRDLAGTLLGLALLLLHYASLRVILSPLGRMASLSALAMGANFLNLEVVGGHPEFSDVLGLVVFPLMLLVAHLVAGIRAGASAHAARASAPGDPSVGSVEAGPSPRPGQVDDRADLSAG